MNSYNFKKGDLIYVRNQGYHYPSYSNAFIAMNFKDKVKNYWKDSLLKDTTFKVIGIFQHHTFSNTTVVGVQYKDIQLAIEDTGCILIKHFELNNKIKIL